MCQSYMQIGYSDAPDIVINYRKSKENEVEKNQRGTFKVAVPLFRILHSLDQKS